jgi:hypothetical protein
MTYTSPEPKSDQLSIAAVFGYAAVQFVAVTLLVFALGALPLLLPLTIVICVSLTGVGLVLVALERQPPSPNRPFWEVLVVVAVIIIICGAFYWPHYYLRSAHLALVTGVLSALSWGLSVAGALIWSHYRVIGSIYWNSWFNLFAAVFASLAVGFMPG